MRAPDVSHLDGNLWIGSAPYNPERYKNFDVIYFCAGEYQPHPSEWPAHTVRLYGFDDRETLSPKMLRLVDEAADSVVRNLRKGKKVLVTCMMGRNRSAFVCALALHKLTGASGARCASFVRRKRPNAGGVPALANRAFADILGRL